VHPLQHAAVDEVRDGLPHRDPADGEPVDQGALGGDGVTG
jgi:hypothetical protein